MVKAGVIVRDSAESVIGRPTAAPDVRFALAITTAFVIVGAISVGFHEPWRDEAQAWLVARDSTGIMTLLRNSRYEGSPVLWQLLLLPFTRTGWLPLMSGLNLAFAAGAVFLFAGFAPFDRPARALFGFGYLPLYEWGTIARSYALGVFLLFLFAVFFSRRRPVLQGVALALAANTSIHAAIVAAAALALLILDRNRRLGDGDRRADRPAFWTGVAVAAAGLVACALQSLPPPDIGFSWLVWRNPGRFASIASAFAAGIAPLADCWFGELFLRRWPWMRVPATAVSGALAVAFLVTAGTCLARRRAVWIVALASWSLLSCLFFCLWWRGPRHAGFLFIATVLALWLAPLFPERRRSQGRLGRWGALGRRRAVPVTRMVLAFQVVTGAVAVVVEVTTVFSAARATARLLRHTGLSALPVVAEPDMMTSNVVAHLGLRGVYYANSDRWGSFVVWDSRHDERRRTDDGRLFERAARMADLSDVAVVLNRPPREGAAERVHAVLVGSRLADIVSDESFWVYRVPQTAGDGPSPP